VASGYLVYALGKESVPFIIPFLLLALFIYGASASTYWDFVKSVLTLLGFVYLASTLSAAFENLPMVIRSLARGEVGHVLPLLAPQESVPRLFTLLNEHIGYFYGSYVDPHRDLVGAVLVAAGVLAVILSFMYTRGQRVYATDRRVIITKRFGGESYFQVYYDKVADTSWNKSIAGRLFGYGSVYFTTLSGTGVEERDRETAPKPTRAITGVKTKVDGVKNPEDLLKVVNEMLQKFIDSLHLMKIEEHTKKIAEEMSKEKIEKEVLAVVGGRVEYTGSYFTGYRCSICGDRLGSVGKPARCPACNSLFHPVCLLGELGKTGRCPQCNSELSLE